MTLPAGRSETGWLAIGWITAAISAWQGAGYAVGGAGVTTQYNGWRPLLALIRSLHVHGLVMLVFAVALAMCLLGNTTDRRMTWTLRLLRTYCLIVSACWVGSWFKFGISWGAPGWWILLAALTTWLAWYSPAGAHRDRR